MLGLFASGYFMYLNTSNINLYKGPGKQYPVSYILTHKYYPLRVIAVYDVWKKVMDYKNDAGWVHQSQLSQKKRIVMSLKECVVKKKQNPHSKTVAIIEPNCIIEVLKIEKDSCLVKVSADGKHSVKGWVPAKNLWGLE